MTYGHDDDEFPEPPRLRRLRWLVTALMVALIVAVLAIAATIVIRLGFGLGEAAGRVSAERFALPDGDIVAVGRGTGSVLFVVRLPDGAERLLVFDESTGEPAGASAIARPANGG